MTWEKYWTLDQALIWLATEDQPVADAAGPGGFDPMSWSTFRLGCPLTREQVELAERTLLRFLRSGDVKAYDAYEGYRQDSAMSPLAFYDAYFYHGTQILLGKKHPAVSDEFSTILIRDERPELLGPQYLSRPRDRLAIYLDPKSLIATCERELAESRALERSENERFAVAFDMSADMWSLRDAIYWVGCEERYAETGKISNKEADCGAVRLFEALSAHKLVATGVRPGDGNEEVVPVEFWGRAYLNEHDISEPLRAEDCNFVDLTRAALLKGSSKALAWKGIRIRVQALMTVFPDVPATGDFETGGVPPTPTNSSGQAESRGSGGYKKRKQMKVRAAICKIYPKGIPAEATNQEIFRSISKYFEVLVSEGTCRADEVPGFDTTMRAAGRRKS